MLSVCCDSNEKLIVYFGAMLLCDVQAKLVRFECRRDEHT